MKKFITSLLTIFFLIETSHAEFSIYPMPSGIKESNLYTIEIIENDRCEKANVYTDPARWNTNNSKDNSWCSLAIDKSVKVRVKALYSSIDFCQVLPRRNMIDIMQIDDSTVEFVIDRPGQYSVEFQRGTFIDHPLFLFVDNMKPKKEIISSPQTIIFNEGIHNIGEKYKIESNQIVYLAPGAYVKGQFYAENAHDITIMGEGILSGEDYAARSHNHMISMKNCDNVRIEGITIINAPRYCIAVGGKNHVCNNVKMMGWWFSTDGISLGNNGLIENCFFKVNDDAIKLYRTNTEARNCIIWQMENGAPFQIGWNMGGYNTNFYVHDMDIIRVEHTWDNPNEAVFDAIHGSKGIMCNYLYENIRIDNCDFRLFHLVTRPNRFGKWNPEKGSIRDVTFRNIECYTLPRMKNIIMGYDAKHPVENITLENIRIGGEKIQKLSELNLITDSITTKNLNLH